MMAKQNESFWQFSTALYEKEAIKHACLQFQTQTGGGVVSILYAVWRGARGEVLITPDEIFAFCQEWEGSLTVLLRQARDMLKNKIQAQTQSAAVLQSMQLPSDLPFSEKNQLEALRQKVLQVELESERQLIQIIEQMPIDWCHASSKQAILENLAKLWEFYSIDSKEECIKNLVDAVQQWHHGTFESGILKQIQ